MVERVGVIYEVIDEASAKLKNINEEMEKSSASSDKLKKKLTQLNAGAVASTIGVVALTRSLTRFYVEAAKAASEAERLNGRLSASNSINDAGSKKWKTFKEDLGAGLIEMKAWALQVTGLVDAQERANATLEKNNKIMKDFNAIVQEAINPMDEVTKKVDMFRIALEGTHAPQELVNEAVEKYRIKVEATKQAEDAEIETKNKLTEASKRQKEALAAEIAERNRWAVAYASQYGGFKGRAPDLSHYTGTGTKTYDQSYLDAHPGFTPPDTQ